MRLVRLNYITFHREDRCNKNRIFLHKRDDFVYAGHWIDKYRIHNIKGFKNIKRYQSLGR